MSELTYFGHLAEQESKSITDNVAKNLETCLKARNLQFNAFLEWAVSHGARKYVAYKLRNTNKIEASFPLKELTLASTYMNKTPQEVFFHTLPIDKFQ